MKDTLYNSIIRFKGNGFVNTTSNLGGTNSVMVIIMKSEFTVPNSIPTQISLVQFVLMHLEKIKIYHPPGMA